MCFSFELEYKYFLFMLFTAWLTHRFLYDANKYQLATSVFPFIHSIKNNDEVKPISNCTTSVFAVLIRTGYRCLCSQYIWLADWVVPTVLLILWFKSLILSSMHYNYMYTFAVFVNFISSFYTACLLQQLLTLSYT